MPRLIAEDSFTVHADGASLEGLVAPIGGTWMRCGGDLQHGTIDAANGRVKRAYTGAAGATVTGEDDVITGTTRGILYRLGTREMAHGRVIAHVQLAFGVSSSTLRGGVFLRASNNNPPTNYLLVYSDQETGAGRKRTKVAKVVNGVQTNLGQSVYDSPSSSSFRVDIDAAGVVTVDVDAVNEVYTDPNYNVVTAPDADLASGGVMAGGTFGAFSYFGPSSDFSVCHISYFGVEDDQRRRAIVV